MSRSASRPWLALALAMAGAAACDQDPAPERFAAQFDRVWADFDATYPYFTLKGVDWAAARDTWRPRAAGAASEQELASVLAQMLGGLRDMHVSIIEPSGARQSTWIAGRFVNFDEATWQAYRARWGVVSHGSWGSGMIGNVPYVYVASWGQPATGFDAVLEGYRDAPGLVLDLRMNGGGNSSYAFQVAGRFADAARLAYTVRYRNGPGHDDFGPAESRTIGPSGPWQFTRPVLLLLGAASASSSEDFSSAMREFPHVSLVGDATAGASANPTTRALAGGWSYTVSRWFFRAADGLVVEGSGIPPHVAVAASAADFAALRDPVLDYAESWAPSPSVVRPP